MESHDEHDEEYEEETFHEKGKPIILSSSLSCRCLAALLEAVACC